MKTKFLLIFSILFNLSFSFESKLKIHFINAGEGDSTLIETSNSNYILVDTGNFISGIDVLHYLMNKKVEVINSLIITHPHPDHIGGVFAISKSINVLNLYDNGEDIKELTTSSDIYRWYENFFRKDYRYKPLYSSEKLQYENLTIEILWPERENRLNDWNANSIVLKVNFGNFNCLLMGDANLKTERELIKKKLNIKASILKAGHHGAEDTASYEFIKEVSPEVVIISVDKNNIKGYPSTNVIKRYEENKAKVYSTAIYGTIIIKANYDGTYEIETEK